MYLLSDITWAQSLICRTTNLQGELLYAKNNDSPVLCQTTDTQIGLTTIPLFSFLNSSVNWWLLSIKNDKMWTKIISVYFAFTYKINRLAKGLAQRVQVCHAQWNTLHERTRLWATSFQLIKNYAGSVQLFDIESRSFCSEPMKLKDNS